MIAIVGGGVLGCTLAYRLARRGAALTLFEQGQIGSSGASSVPVALLNPYRGRSARASAFDLNALEAMWQLEAEVAEVVAGLGYATGVRQSGVLRVASNAKQAKTWRQRGGVQWLEPDAVPANYHAPFGGFLVVQGGWLEPKLWLRALSEAAQAAGAWVHEGCAVEALERTASGFMLRTITGTGEIRTFSADQVVLCGGSSPPLKPEPVGLERVAGEVVGLRSGAALPYPLAGAVYGAQLGETFFLGGNHRPATQGGAGDAADAPTQLQRSGSWFIPSLRDAERRSVWHGVRVRGADNLPVVQQLEPGLWFAGALAGRGFLCAAEVSKTLAAQLLEEVSEL